MNDDEAQFLWVGEALEWAYRVSATYLYQGAGSMIGQGSPPTNPDRLTPHERHAQAAFIASAIRAALGSGERIVVDTYHYAPNTPYKAALVRELATSVVDNHPSRTIHPEWVWQMVAEWANQPPSARLPSWWTGQQPPTDFDWARYLERNRSNISRWRNGHGSNPGITEMLDRWMAEAKSKLGPVFRDRCLVRDNATSV